MGSVISPLIFGRSLVDIKNVRLQTNLNFS